MDACYCMWRQGGMGLHCFIGVHDACLACITLLFACSQVAAHATINHCPPMHSGARARVWPPHSGVQEVSHRVAPQAGAPSLHPPPHTSTPPPTPLPPPRTAQRIRGPASANRRDPRHATTTLKVGKRCGQL